jgi:multidrug resistance efflux pump
MSQAPIPIPLKRRLAHWQSRLLPSGLFFLLCLAVLILWQENLSLPSLVGQVDIRRLDIRTTASGTITNLSVQLFQKVRRGEIIAKLDPADPMTSLSSQADLLLAKKELLQLLSLTTASSEFDIQRNLLDKERLRTEWLQQKVNLASAEIRMENLRNEYERAKGLREQELLSESQYDLAEKNFLSTEAEVKERQIFSEDLSRTIASIEGLIANSQEIETARMEIDRTSLKRSIARLEQEWVIRAPADGIITGIQKRQGELVGSSDSIVTLTEDASNTVVAYLPQGLEVPLSIGETVTIRSRSQQLRQASAMVVRMGTSFEIMPDMISQLQLHRLGGLGIPILIQVPDTLDCKPGEMVNIVLEKKDISLTSSSMPSVASQ